LEGHLQKVELFRNIPTHWLPSVFQSFPVSERDKSKALLYYKEHAREYNQYAARGWLKELRVRERSLILQFADFKHAGKTMIDVGCGGGFYSMAAKRAGMKVCAVDAVPAMLENLKGKVDEIRLLGIESIRLEKSFDLVLCAGVLDFVKNPERSFKNLCNLVSPQGKLVILVPKTGLCGIFYRLEKKTSGINVNLYTSQWLVQNADRNRFSIEQMKSPLPFNLAAVFRPT
jgi:2-polyprenyl-3-methyl-5-hydroxy-6-metoxy-1,4-benzoquinol methylase